MDRFYSESLDKLPSCCSSSVEVVAPYQLAATELLQCVLAIRVSIY